MLLQITAIFLVGGS